MFRKWVVLTVIVAMAIPAFARMEEPPRSFANKVGFVIQQKTLPAVDVQKLLSEDRERTKNSRAPQPLRFANPVQTSFDLTNSGTWQDLPDGRLWRLQIISPNATNQNVGITRFSMTGGAKLWIYDPQRTHIEGPYTARDRNKDGGLWTPIIEGDSMVIELFVPAGTAQPSLLIGRVNQGYRGVTKKNDKGGLGGSEGACENDVICPEGVPWADEIRAVLVYTVNGTNICTGTLMNDVPVDFKPYVLSANHCGVSSANAGTIVAYFNFQSPTCGTHGPGSLADNLSGAYYRASYAPSDFLLFEMQAMPPGSYNVYHAGWDATGVAPPSTVAIHHPVGDVKAISFSNTPPQPMAYYGTIVDPTANHWRADWDDGVTEPGSSGSCLFSTTDHRCIGQLHGGPSYCGASAADLHDFYGRFSVSWEGGGTSSTRLKDWLDPGNTGILSWHGDPHLTTANGVHYDFQGGGEFISLRTPDGSEIQTRMTPVSTSYMPGADPYDGIAACVALSTAVAARVDNHRVTIQPNLNGVPDPSGLQVRVDGALTNVGTGGVAVGNGRISKSPAGSGYEIQFPNGMTVDVSSLYWTSQGKWYLNVDLFKGATARSSGGASPANARRTGGLQASIAPGSWLPALPDGSTVGPMPASVSQRYTDLYQKFGNAWRVTMTDSLFDYAPGTSTDTFTYASWPPNKPPCTVPKSEPAKPVSTKVATAACADVRDKAMRANCIFDVGITGERGFAKLYQVSEQLRRGATTVTVSDAKNPTAPREAATFTATVSSRSGAAVTSGTIRFLVDGKPAGDALRVDRRGSVSYKTDALAGGTHTIAAAYTPLRGGTDLPSTSLDVVHMVREANSGVVITGLDFQAGDENTPCPPVGVTMSRKDAYQYPLLERIMSSFDARCAERGAGLMVTSLELVRCAKDPRGVGFGPNATVNLICGKP